MSTTRKRGDLRTEPYTPKELAQRWPRTSERQIRRWLEAGHLHGHRDVGRWHIPVAAVEEFEHRGYVPNQRSAS